MLVVTIKVMPSSGCIQWVQEKSGQIKCYLKSAPEKGQANKELIKLIAKGLSIHQSSISIISGMTTRLKMIRIVAPITIEQFLAAFNMHKE